MPRNGTDPSPERPWGEPAEISISEMSVRHSVYAPLQDDIVLRLDKTNDNRALAYPMLDAQAACKARDSIASAFKKRFGPGFAVFSVRKAPPMLYVRRGPNWKKSE